MGWAKQTHPDLVAPQRPSWRQVDLIAWHDDVHVEVDCLRETLVMACSAAKSIGGWPLSPPMTGFRFRSTHPAQIKRFLKALKRIPRTGLRRAIPLQSRVRPRL
jgi:hypothetical protein